MQREEMYWETALKLLELQGLPNTTLEMLLLNVWIISHGTLELRRFWPDKGGNPTMRCVI